MESARLALVISVFVLAGGVKGVTGMGLPTVAMSLLGLCMPPEQAAALLVAPSLATNVAQCRGPYFRSLVARLWPGWLALVAMTMVSPGLGGGEGATSASRWLGAVLVAYGLWGLWRPSLPDLSASGRWVGATAGVATGVVTSWTAVFVLPWVPYLQSLRLGKDETVQALGLSFTIATVALAFRLQASPHGAGWSAFIGAAVLAALAGAFAGLKLGEHLRARLAGPAFQKALFVVFVGLGVANVARGW